MKKIYESHVKQTSRRNISREREKYKTPVRRTSKTLVRVQKNPVRKSIPQLEII